MARKGRKYVFYQQESDPQERSKGNEKDLEVQKHHRLVECEDLRRGVLRFGIL
jgi:hypothetical protein